VSIGVPQVFCAARSQPGIALFFGTDGVLARDKGHFLIMLDSLGASCPQVVEVVMQKRRLEQAELIGVRGQWDAHM
jgi:hypothetical protein